MNINNIVETSKSLSINTLHFKWKAIFKMSLKDWFGVISWKSVQLHRKPRTSHSRTLVIIMNIYESSRLIIEISGRKIRNIACKHFFKLYCVLCIVNKLRQWLFSVSHKTSSLEIFFTLSMSKGLKIIIWFSFVRNIIEWSFICKELKTLQRWMICAKFGWNCDFC